MWQYWVLEPCGTCTSSTCPLWLLHGHTWTNCDFSNCTFTATTRWQADGIWPHLNPSPDIFATQAAPFADPPVNVNNDSNYAARVVQTHICPQFHPSIKFWPAFFTNLHASLTARFMLHDVWCSRILRKTSRFKHNWSKSSHHILLVPLCLFLLLFCSWQILLQSQTKCSLETWTIPEGSKGVWLLRNLYGRGCFCSWFFLCCWCAGLQVARCGKKEICKQAQKKHRKTTSWTCWSVSYPQASSQLSLLAMKRRQRNTCTTGTHWPFFFCFSTCI